MMSNNNQDINIQEVLSFIDPSCSHDDWIKVGMALKEEGYPYETFRDWSSESPDKFNERDCLNAWMSFKKTGISIGTLIWMAQQNGYSSSNGKYYEENGKQYKSRMEMKDDFNGTLYFEELDNDLIIKDEGWLKPEEFFEPTDYEWNPRKELIEYLEALFDPNDIIAYTTQSRENARGKLAPYTKGVYSRKAIDLINILKEPNGTIEKAIGTYDNRAGVWIRINPFDGQGVEDANVVAYKHALVESDEMDIAKQIAIMKALRLPIAALVFSGGKSVHAIVKVDAQSQKEYKRKVDFIYETCNKNGLKTDTSNKNESRLSRMPGVIRGNHKQFLIATDIGCQTYEEWQEWVEKETDELPDPVDMADIWDDLPPRKPELIEGILRETHIMNLSGSSKTGKTYLMQELALAIATGDEWLGHKCTQGEVLYIDAEVDKSSSLNNINEVAKAKGYTKEMIGKNLMVWNIRGYATQIQKLLPSIIRRFKKKNLKLIIIDPMYKINEGDENSAKDMSEFTRGLDQLSVTLNCAIAYVHHFAKGNQAEKDSIDRASGSGVIGRHGDALLSVSRLNAKSQEDESMIPLRLEGTVREFAPLEPINMWFKHPIHILDEVGELEYAKIGTGKEKPDKYTEFANLLECAFESCNPQWNEKAKRYEVFQVDIVNWMFDASKSKGTIESYRKNFLAMFKKIIQLGRTTLRKAKQQKGNAKVVIYRLNLDDEIDDDFE